MLTHGCGAAGCEDGYTSRGTCTACHGMGADLPTRAAPVTGAGEEVGGCPDIRPAGDTPPAPLPAHGDPCWCRASGRVQGCPYCRGPVYGAPVEAPPRWVVEAMAAGRAARRAQDELDAWAIVLVDGMMVLVLLGCGVALGLSVWL